MDGFNVDTVCALSTPLGKSALGVIRISGPRTKQIILELSGSVPPKRRPALKILKDSNGNPIDEVVITFYPEPNSYTGEDLAEICVHGNPSILEKTISEIVSRETRLAEPGEFTRRALANGKLTLDQVESLDLILNATSFQGVRTALRSKLRGLSEPVEDFTKELLNLLTTIQSQLDFSELEVGQLNKREALIQMDHLILRLDKWSKTFESYKPYFENWTAVLIGPPNSGKSSLFNALIGTEKALVYNQPGTTRDAVEAVITMNGINVLLVDTAGIRNSSDPIEALGVQKTMERMKTADVLCWISDLGEEAGSNMIGEYANKKWIFITSKIDTNPPIIRDSLIVSAKTGVGLKQLKEAIKPNVQAADEPEHSSVLTSVRQKNLVIEAKTYIEQAKTSLMDGEYLDLVAESVLQANQSLNEIINKIPTEDVLNRVFSRFCIGK